jgi:hypothetical protein
LPHETAPPEIVKGYEQGMAHPSTWFGSPGSLAAAALERCPLQKGDSAPQGIRTAVALIQDRRGFGYFFQSM